MWLSSSACYIINGKAACPDYTALIFSAFDKEENEMLLIIKELAQEKHTPWCYMT